MMNAYHGDLDFHFPKLPTPLVWEALVDTAEPTGPRRTPGGSGSRARRISCAAHSFALFINRAPTPPSQARRSTASARGASDDDGGDCRGRSTPLRGGRVMRRHHELPFGAEIVRGRAAGRALPAVGAARRRRGAGARRERGAADPDAAGAGRLVFGDDRPRRRRFALPLPRRRRRLTPTRPRATSRTACMAPARSSIPAPIDWRDTGWRGRPLGRDGHLRTASRHVFRERRFRRRDRRGSTISSRSA